MKTIKHRLILPMQAKGNMGKSIEATARACWLNQAAEKIAEVERLMNYNREAFRQLAIAQVPIRVVRSESYGVINPRCFALIVEGADSVETRNEDGTKNGYTFFTSPLSEEQIQSLQAQMPKTNGNSK